MIYAGGCVTKLNMKQHCMTNHHIRNIRTVECNGECGTKEKKHSLSHQEACFIHHLDNLPYLPQIKIVIHCQEMQQETFNMAREVLNYPHKIQLYYFSRNNEWPQYKREQWMTSIQERTMNDINIRENNECHQYNRLKCSSHWKDSKPWLITLQYMYRTMI